jgi:hypothetical protein
VEDGLGVVAEAGAAAEQDQRLAGQVGQPHLATVGQPVARTGDQDQLVGVQRRRLDLRVTEGAHDAELHLVVQHHLEDLLGGAGLDGQAHARMPGAEAGQRVGQDVGADGRRRAEDQPAGDAAAQLVQALAAVAEGTDDVLGVGQERLPGVGEPHAAPGADEQLLAEVGLQRLKSGGQGGLGHEQGLCGPAQVLAPGHLQEGLDLREHVPPSGIDDPDSCH